MDMDLREKFSLRDVSNYTTYQMISYSLQHGEKQLLQKADTNMFMYKVSPTQYGLYNYCYFFSKDVSIEQFEQVKDFFWNESYRVVIEKDEHLRCVLEGY